MRLLTGALLGLGAYATYRWLATPRYDFRDKHVLITGGARGLGLLMARELAESGARLTLCSRNLEDLAQARAEFMGRGVTVLALRCDVTEQQQVADLVQHATNHFGPVDVLINNAGIIGVGPLEEMKLTDFEQAMKTHFWGSLYTTLEVLPQMRQRRTGRIVNVASIGGKIAVPHMLPYTASKFALVGLSAGLRNELARDGIVVTTVCPGVMRTGSHLQAQFKGQNELEYAWFAAASGMPGFSIDAEAAAHTILQACARGDAELVLSLPAKLAVLLQALAPELLSYANQLVNQFLPEPGGIGTQSARGYESRGVVPPLMTTLADEAAVRNNETNPVPQLT